MKSFFKKCHLLQDSPAEMITIKINFEKILFVVSIRAQTYYLIDSRIEKPDFSNRFVKYLKIHNDNHDAVGAFFHSDHLYIVYHGNVYKRYSMATVLNREKTGSALSFPDEVVSPMSLCDSIYSVLVSREICKNCLASIIKL